MKIRGIVQLSLLAALTGREANALQLQPSLRAEPLGAQGVPASHNDGIEEIFTDGARAPDSGAADGVSKAQNGALGGMNMPHLSNAHMKMLVGLLAAAQLPTAMGGDCSLSLYSSVSDYQDQNNGLLNTN